MPEPEPQVQPPETEQSETVKKSQLVTDAEYQKQKIETRVDLDMPDLNSSKGKLLLSEALRYTLANLETIQKQTTDEIEAIKATQDRVDGDFLDLTYQFSRLEKSNKLDGLVLELDEKIDPHQAGKMLVSEDTGVKESINKRAEYIVQQGYLTTKDDAVLLLKSIYKASLYRLVGNTLLRDLKEFTVKKEKIPEMIGTLMASAQPPV